MFWISIVLWYWCWKETTAAGVEWFRKILNYPVQISLGPGEKSHLHVAAFSFMVNWQWVSTTHCSSDGDCFSASSVRWHVWGQRSIKMNQEAKRGRPEYGRRQSDSRAEDDYFKWETTVIEPAICAILLIISIIRILFERHPWWHHVAWRRIVEFSFVSGF